ncbi:aspartate/glutamate racemase family protein [Pseudaminobacter sp. NGMCC 1.201702]|uniref:aspartate/glutamate racemase family protein n=1 Tax=Pseudaminobacter sp. NGMCC 1.201702 TaxID=3391825 RepID=UPI0039F07819
MRIVIVQPNTTQAVSDRVADAARRAAGPNTRIEVVTAPFGAPSIEFRSEAAIAAHAILEAFAHRAQGADAGIVAGFGDPGVAASKELFAFPVIGLAEAAMLTACMLGGRFSILTVGPRWGQMLRETAAVYGLSSRLASIRTIAGRVHHASPSDEWLAAFDEAGRMAVAEDGAEVLIVGGGGVSGLARQLAESVDVPVLDGVDCAVRMAEMLVSLGVRKPVTGSYSSPKDKQLHGIDDTLARLFQGG